ncbi:MAG: hypothetical protein O7C75_04110, partial [Verrucomicrobia bacterium]|nr:hypothetical protein [Verrucomicrobiota bacterium]
EEEQELLQEYLMGGRVTESNPLIRRIYSPLLGWVENRVKVASGGRYSFLNCYPDTQGPFPVVLVLDPEIGPQAETGMEAWARVVQTMHRLASERGGEVPPSTPRDRFLGYYITRNPIGNQLISHSISVIIPIGESLENANTLSTEDWKSVLDFFLSKNYLDSKSFFLFATQEYADLAIRLATAFPFTGLILEEPESGLFATTFPADTKDSKIMEPIRKVYLQHLEKLNAPTLLFRNKKNPVIEINDDVLLKPLLDSKRPLNLILTDYPMRIVDPSENQDESARMDNQPTPRFAYDPKSVEKIVDHMLYFILQNGSSPIDLLPQGPRPPRSNKRTQRILDAANNIERKMLRYMNQR